MVKLGNEHLQVEISAEGAELRSLRSAATGMEYLWQADERHWDRTAPILFHVVGKLAKNRFFRDGKEYSLPQHGFARDLTFEVLQTDGVSAVFGLGSTPETLRQWPFPFLLKVAYRLDGTTLRVEYGISNLAEYRAPFSLGFHPGFRCPLAEGEAFEDYEVLFDEMETLPRHLLRDGLRTGATGPFLETERHVPLRRALFASGAVVLQGHRSRMLRFWNPATGNGILCGIGDFPWLGLWSKGQAPFVCVEPWCGVADRLDASGILEDKEGLLWLSPGESRSGGFFLAPLRAR